MIEICGKELSEQMSGIKLYLPEHKLHELYIPRYGVAKMINLKNACTRDASKEV